MVNFFIRIISYLPEITEVALIITNVNRDPELSLGN